MKSGILVVNLGTPDKPEPKEVGEFLREFLMDPEVITAPGLIRWLLVNVLIVPRRKYTSAENYKKVWFAEGKGSPLMHYSKELTRKLSEQLSQTPIALGMRYGSPSLSSAIQSLVKEGCQRVVVFPMFPQYSSATTKTAFDKIRREAPKDVELEFFDSYSSDRFYIKAQAELIRSSLESLEVEHHILSFHGLPESILKKQDPSGSHCLIVENCCEMSCSHKSGDVFKVCYRAQCLDTAKAIADEMGWNDEQWTMTFQSRLGPTKWTTPSTDDTVLELAKRGVKSVSVACPAFTTDCLETLEEIAIGLKQEFIEAGGENLTVVPCLNDNDSWVKGVASFLNHKI